MKTQKETNISTASEYIHYSQYAILTILMVLWLDPKRTRSLLADPVLGHSDGHI